MFSSDKERNYFFSWYFRAQSDSNCDSEKQFFYFYALFNHLFNSFSKENENKLKRFGLTFRNDEKEMNKMRFYLFYTFYLDSEKEYFKDFNPFVMLKNCRKEKLIERIKKHVSNSVFETHELPDYSELEILFSEIYKLRCDLFHGDTNLSDYDRNLYDEINMVLKEFLDRVFIKNVSETDLKRCLEK